jgi:glucokinase
MIYSNNIPYKNTNIRQIFSGITKTPVYIDNDANCAALGEATSGGAKGYADSITVTLGTGVGGGIIINGKIYSGHNYAGGELGHHVIMMGGEQCSCGRKGCFEAYASATALIRDTKKAASLHPDSKINSICDNNTENIDAKTVFIAKRAGDPYAAELVDNYIRYLGEGISNIINIFQPDIVLIGGGISKEGDGLLNPLREFVRHNTYKSEGISKTLIRQAVLGNDAGIIGAAMLG